MRTANSRLNSWNTSNTSFQNAENRPVTAQKVVEHRQETYRNARLRRVKSAVGSQRTLNPNVERLLKSSKQKIKRAKPTRHFKAWNDRETAPPQKEKKYRKDDLKSRLPTRGKGAKKAVENFASSLRGGSTREKKRRYRRPTSSNQKKNVRERSKNYAKAQEALLAQKRMKKAKAAALKAKQIERQMQHVRRIKKLDTTIRPVLGNRTNTMSLPLSMKVDAMHRNYHDEEDDNDLDHDISDSSMEEEKFKFIDSRNDQENDHENDNFIPNFNTTSSDEDDTKYEGDPNRWNPMFGNILSPLQETNEEESQSLSTALSPDARQILNSAREKRAKAQEHYLRQVRTTTDDSTLHNGKEANDDMKQHVDRDIYGAVSPENGKLRKVKDDNILNSKKNTSPHKLSASLDGDFSADENSCSMSSSSDEEDDEGTGVEALARNFYSGMKTNIDAEKTTVKLQREDVDDANEKYKMENMDVAKDDSHDDDNEEHDDYEEDEYEESFIEDDSITDSKKQEDNTIVKEKRSDIDVLENDASNDDDNDEKPVWNTPRTRRENSMTDENHVNDTNNDGENIINNDMQSPRTFVNQHMTFLRAKTFQKWSQSSTAVDESGEQYSDDDFEELDEMSTQFDTVKEEETSQFSDYGDEEFEKEVDPRKSLRDSVNKKFAQTLQSQLKKELSHTDLFNSNNTKMNNSDGGDNTVDSQDSKKPRKGGIAFVC